LEGVFPNLELLVHGGVNFAPYRNQFAELLAGGRAELREVYPASEGFFAIADRGSGEGMRLIVDNGLFYEFVAVGELATNIPKRHWLADVQSDVNYALVISSCAGFWSYVVGDTIRLVELHPPRVLVTGRLSYFLSAFGEHLTAEEIEAAVSAAADTAHVGVADFAVGAVFPDTDDTRGGHAYIVELSREASDSPWIKGFAQTLDEKLCHGNDDYRAHRSGSFGLPPPEVIAAPHGTFAAWMKQKGQLGGQHKVPRVITDQVLFTELRRFVAGMRGGSHN
jgi:GH3 auxin-responsive promoter